MPSAVPPNPLLCALDFASNWEIRGGVWRYGIELTRALVSLLGPEAVLLPVYDRLPDERLAYSSVLTMMRILEQKEYVTHEKSGRAFIYRPLVDRRTAQQSVIGYLLKRFFNNSPEQLVVNLLEHEEVGPREVKRLKKMISDSE